MYIFISSLVSLNILFLWLLLISSKKSQSKEEKFVEDNLQMQYLKEYKNKKNRKYYFDVL